MDQALLTAAAGLRARFETLELIGNNMANVATAGFKADREFYNLFLGVEADEIATGEFAWMPVVEGSVIDFRQGALTVTAGRLDVALSGPGFLAVDGPKGPLFTRSGNLRRSAAGRLETPEGFPVQGEGGPLTLPPGEVKFGEDGTVSVGAETVGRLRIVEFASTQVLSKVGHSYFQSSDPAGVQPAARTTVRQGHLEGSNVNPAEAAVHLVAVTRQFEMLTRAVALVANEMNRRVIDELPSGGG